MRFPADDLIGKWFGNYRVVQVVKEGGLAGHWCAHDPFSNRYVAIAVSELRGDGDDSFISRFESVARVLRDLKHPNILTAYDWGHDHNYFYCVKELCAAVRLDAQLRQGPLPVPETGRMLRKFASALSAVHSKQIFHRDIKPSSVLIDRREERVWLTNFGLPPNGGGVFGTLRYMAPELLKAQPIDVRAEVYALGLLVFQMLSGELPFDDGPPWSAVAFQKDLKQAPALNKLRPEVPKRMAAAVSKAISRDPESRFATADEFANEAWPDQNM
jgi:serine/threonine protein kinase